MNDIKEQLLLITRMIAESPDPEERQRLLEEARNLVAVLDG